MKITVNGEEHEVEGPTLSHEQIIELAGQPIYASVVYVGPRHGDARRSGTTCKGESVEIEDGMQFDAVVTGNA